MFKYLKSLRLNVEARHGFIPLDCVYCTLATLYMCYEIQGSSAKALKVKLNMTTVYINLKMESNCFKTFEVHSFGWIWPQQITMPHH